VSAVFHLNKEAKLELQQRYHALLLRAQIPRSNVGWVAHVAPTLWATSHKADITRRAVEAACWLQLGCFSNNSANSHAIPGPFNHRVLRSRLVPQCSYPPHRPRHQRRLANCDWRPASHPSGQPSNPRRHPTCWASSQRSHTISRTPFHRAWTPAPPSAHPSIECRYTAPQMETPIFTRCTITQFFLTTTTYVRRIERIINGMQSGRTTLKDSAFSFQTPVPFLPVMTLPRRAWVRLNRLRTGVVRFHSWLYKWGMASSVTCECRRRTNRRPCCPPMSNPPTSSWTDESHVDMMISWWALCNFKQAITKYS